MAILVKIGPSESQLKIPGPIRISNSKTFIPLGSHNFDDLPLATHKTESSIKQTAHARQTKD
jgi:hypothetical protein